MGGQIEIFKPRESGKVKVFTCGPSIYRRPHIGNYRTFLYEDILVRYLEYLGYDVKRIINFTDLEDKTIEESLTQEKNIDEITAAAADHFYGETRDLKIKLPDVIPSSSGSVAQAVEIIKTLVKKGHAYFYGKDVFFDPLTFPGFGKLFGLDMSTWPEKKIRFHRDTYNGNRWNKGDFILWHSDKGEHVHFWDTSIGRGRPSWNVQDPAMIVKHLGEQVDINCGGIDNIYRHHDYNIAVMESFTGKEYAKYYLHGEHLLIDGRTMSKSRGNILYPEDVYKSGYSPLELRFFLTATKHYRKKLDFSLEKMDNAARDLKSLKKKIADLLAVPDNGEKHLLENKKTAAFIADIEPEFKNGMDDDLFLKKAVDNVEKLIDRIKASSPHGLSEIERKDLKDHIQQIDRVIYSLLD
jgi:cysteinyl-tRNA synthetase